MELLIRTSSPRPFLKWAGGKTQLLPQLEAFLPSPDRVRRYLEPFVGSAALFFLFQSRFGKIPTILADGNSDLIRVYCAIRDQVEEVIQALRRHRLRHSQHSEAHYYRVRALKPERLSPPARAARLIYLNKTCFNGLYRVNRRGEFNVPMGRYKNPPILDADNLRAVSEALKGVELKHSLFNETPKYARRGDFVYFDPPYHPLSATSSFTSYTPGLFSAADQEELARVYVQLSHKGCRVMLSNSSTPLIRRLYRDFEIRTVQARRSINSKGDRRGKVPEVVVLNFEPGPS